MTYTDEWIVEQWSMCPDVWAIVETMVDGEVSAGEYEGCSTELELAWLEHRGHVVRALGAAGIEVEVS